MALSYEEKVRQLMDLGLTREEAEIYLDDRYTVEYAA